MTREEFARRRRQLMRLMGRDSIAVLPAAPVRQRNNDVEYPYRQDSDFHYLTGFGEPQAVAVLVPGQDRKSTRLNSSHGYISYAVFCLKKKNQSQPSQQPPERA